MPRCSSAPSNIPTQNVAAAPKEVRPSDQDRFIKIVEVHAPIIGLRIPTSRKEQPAPPERKVSVNPKQTGMLATGLER